MKKGNNKGFSLIEIVIGIGVLAVIITPILQTFITSAKINRDSRRVMIETEVAQTIMEGFAGKTFINVKSSEAEIKSPSGAVVSGNAALSTIDGNRFNTAGVYVAYDKDNSNMPLQLTSVSKYDLLWQGTHMQNTDLVSNNSVIASMNQVFGNDVAKVFNANVGILDSDTRMFSSWMDDSGLALFIAYGDIHYEGYRYDAVVSFLPMAKGTADEYYTYRIVLTLYEYKPEMGNDERFTHLLMVMDGGIMAGK